MKGIELKILESSNPIFCIIMGGNSKLKLSLSDHDFKTEIVAGLTTFLAMSYILFVNPQILSSAGMDKSALIAATCMASGIGTMLVGIFTNTPIAMAPGMGLNAFFAYSLVLGEKIPWQTALGIVFLSGLLFLLLTLAGVRAKLVEAIPRSLVFAISVGIGIFITFIGLVNLGLVVKNDVTLVGMGKFTPTVLIGLVGLLVMVVLEFKKVKGSLLIGIFIFHLNRLDIRKDRIPFAGPGR